MQKAYLIFCSVAWSNAADHLVGTELPGVCQRKQTRERATDQHTTTEISMVSHRNRPIRVEQKQLLISSSRLLFTVSRSCQIDLNHFSWHHLSPEEHIYQTRDS